MWAPEVVSGQAETVPSSRHCAGARPAFSAYLSVSLEYLVGCEWGTLPETLGTDQVVPFRTAAHLSLGNGVLSKDVFSKRIGHLCEVAVN